MKPTAFALPRYFVDQIGFNEAVRRAIRLPTDPGLVEIFQKLAPDLDWASAQATPGNYLAPRWMGYWGAGDTFGASDGVLKLAVPQPGAMAKLFRQVETTHFRGGRLIPFVHLAEADPTHMLLHDTENTRLWVAPFEQAEATLVKQLRVSA